MNGTATGPASPARGVWGLVLAGGQSRRMGQNKALLEFGGQTLLARSFATLAAVTDNCLVSCQRNGFYEGYPLVQDTVEGFGPVAGICAGLEAAARGGAGALLVLACDLPLLAASMLSRLRLENPECLCHAFLNPVTGKREMTAAIYRPEALVWFRSALDNGIRRLQDVIPEDRVCLLACLPEEAWQFINCNSPGDLAIASSALNKTI